MTGNIYFKLQLHSWFSILVFFCYLITYLLLQSVDISGTSTVKCYDKFDLEKDVETIHTIVRNQAGFTPDVDKMVRMVCHRCREQRLEMKRVFKEKYKTEIQVYCKDSSDGELSFGDLLDDCFQTTLDIYRNHLNYELTYPLKGLDKEAIVEIMLSIPPEKKQEFLAKYNESKRDLPISILTLMKKKISKKIAYQVTLNEEIRHRLRDDFRNIIEEMEKRTRLADIPPDQINWDLAKKDAQLLHDGRKKWKNHRLELDRILLETPIHQLNAILTEFKNVNGKELDEVLDEHMQKDKQGSYKSMVFFAKNKHDFYARRIEKAMKGLGTKDHTINRIVTVHSEDDLQEIATAFQLNTAESLIDALVDETTMHHEMLITCLAGKPTVKEHV